MLEQLGIPMEKPIRHLREYLSILMPLLHDGKVDFAGETLSCRAELFKKPESPPPVLVAALGPQALRVTGRLADGTSLAWVGPRTVREHVAPTIRRRGGRGGTPGAAHRGDAADLRDQRRRGDASASAQGVLDVRARCRAIARCAGARASRSRRIW